MAANPLLIFRDLFISSLPTGVVSGLLPLITHSPTWVSDLVL